MGEVGQFQHTTTWSENVYAENKAVQGDNLFLFWQNDSLVSPYWIPFMTLYFSEDFLFADWLEVPIKDAHWTRMEELAKALFVCIWTTDSAKMNVLAGSSTYVIWIWITFDLLQH